MWHNHLGSYVGITCSIYICWCVPWKTHPLWLRSFLFWYCYWILFHRLSFLVHFWNIAIDCVKNYLLGPENSLEDSNAWLHPQREPIMSDEKKSELKQNVLYAIYTYCVCLGATEGTHRCETFNECKSSKSMFRIEKRIANTQKVMVVKI